MQFIVSNKQAIVQAVIKKMYWAVKVHSKSICVYIHEEVPEVYIHASRTSQVYSGKILRVLR